MRIRVLSDLHLEMGDWTPPPRQEDVVVLAGDIHLGPKGVQWAARRWPDTPVIYVPGNHEYYGDAYPHMCDVIRAAAQGTSVRVLSCDEVSVGGVRFLGCTLWTDFLLHGEERRNMAMLYCTAVISDYTRIRLGPRWKPLRPRDTIALHEQCLGWLKERCNHGPGDAPVVVVTHHAPSARSLAVPTQDQTLSAAYASALDALIRGCGAALWVHGHTHERAGYTLGATRVECNPRGYPDLPNPRFDEGLVLEVPRGG